MGKFSEAKTTEPTKIQKEIIYGSLLGDMGIYKRKNYVNYNINMSHSIKQIDYFMWKFNGLQPYFNKYRRYLRKNGYEEMASDSITLPFLHEFASWFYIDKTKIIPKNLYDKLTPISLATWFMDDGHTKKQDGLASIATMCFSRKDHELIQHVLLEKYNLVSGIKEDRRQCGKVYISIKFNRENSIKLFDIIDEHVIDSMKYKILNPQRLHAEHYKIMMI